MGISNFNSWIKQTYPSCLIRNKENNKPIIKNYDHIYIDLNFLLHNSIYTSNNQKSFLNNLFTSIDKIITTNHALKSITIAIDGSGSYAKIKLQKSRRLQKSNNCDLSKFSSLHLTPGTKFMNSLNEHIKNYIKSRQRWFKFRHVKFNFYDSNTKDEGELKIFHQLKKNGKKNSDTHLVVGNDADLIVMALAIENTNNISILIKENKSYCLIDIDKLILEHGFKFCNFNSKEQIIFYSNFIRKDFSCLSLFLGNDYLPKMFFINYKNLWPSYLKTRKQLSTLFLVRKNSFNQIFFIKLLENIIDTLKPSYKKVPDTFDEFKIKNYISGILWCLEMYSKGKCYKYDFYIEENTEPNPLIIYNLLKLNKLNLIPPKSKIKPMSSNICSLLLLPKKALCLVDKQTQLKSLKINKYYEIEECNECNNFKNKICFYGKEIFRLRQETRETDVNNDNEILKYKKELSKCKKNKDEHFKIHKNIPTIEEARKILEKVE